MAGARPKLIAWDSCIFLAWFKGEKDKPLNEIELLLRDVDSGKTTLLVSALVRAEVLDTAGESDAGTQFKEFCRKPNVARVNVDFRVSDLAATFRESATQALKQGAIDTGIKAPDAIIAATAKIYKADSLHSFDPVLLGLSGSPIIGGLIVVRPDSGYASNLELPGFTE